MSDSWFAADAGLRLDTERDALDAMGNDVRIFTPEDLHPDFLDLSSGLAGSVFQKFVNYGYAVVFVLPEPERYGDRIVELAREHREHPLIRVVASLAEAQEWLDANL